MRSMTKKITAALFAVAAAVTLTACNEQQTAKNGAAEARTNERTAVDSTYEKLVANQPAHTMNFSPTRATKNFWIDTWGKEPGKLSYVYLQSADGKLLGYYVLEGLPVNYCTSLVPTWDTVSDVEGKVVVPRASMDGTWSSGNNCNAYYGKDATTGSYIEYTAGLGINVLLYDQPLPRQDVQPLGQTRIENLPK